MKKKLPSCCFKVAEKDVIPVLAAGIHLRKSLFCKEIDGANHGVLLPPLRKKYRSMGKQCCKTQPQIALSFPESAMAWNG